MLYGGYKARRGFCCRCASAGRPLYTLQVEPGRKPWLKLAKPGDPDNAACLECFNEIAAVILGAGAAEPIVVGTHDTPALQKETRTC